MEGDRKVSRRSEETPCPYSNRPERFDTCPQVLSRESLSGSCFYWEVSWSGWVVLGVAYPSLGRKGEGGQCALGENAESWGFGWAGSGYHAWHNGEEISVEAPCSHRIGVHLDWPQGALAFYSVSETPGPPAQPPRLLHTFRARFREPLHAAFWLSSKSTVTLC
ncbi:Neoverrucotoxin subunit alpha [Acipenser ruthenus]|uniref:Neoverrucotoxin subunit alpha n=1 Tax=Acipenser ruthenus TaxID=7906 RepID=A0A444V093_ACIRT|nr:Neoverrucotoxin subunit alpha [Acipenser ruthenus]